MNTRKLKQKRSQNAGVNKYIKSVFKDHEKCLREMRPEDAFKHGTWSGGMKFKDDGHRFTAVKIPQNTRST